MRVDKIMGLANSVLGGNRGEAIKLIAKGAQMWRDANNPDAAGAAPGQPGQPGAAGPGPGAPPSGGPGAHAPASPYGAPPPQHAQSPYGAPPQPQHAPPPQQDEGLEQDEWAILRIMAAAAQADGNVAPHEQSTILGQAQKLGASPSQLQQLNFELRQRVSVSEIVQQVDSVAARKLMYQFAFAMVKSDHQVTQSEIAFLNELAKATELSHDVLGQLVRGA